jgi:hypothetical protein
LDAPRRGLAHSPRSARLILAHQTRVANDVGGEDRGKFPDFGHGAASDLEDAITNDSLTLSRGKSVKRQSEAGRIKFALPANGCP